MDSITWIFSGVGITILGGIVWIAKNYFFHLKFEPVVKVQDRSDMPIVLPLCQPADINSLVNATVTAEDRRLPLYNLANLNPYNNPWLVTPEGATIAKNQRLYMTQRTQYLKSYRDYQTQIITQQQSDLAMVPIPLMLQNRGRAKGEHIEIELTLRGMLYSADNKTEHQATRILRPTDNGRNNAAYIMSLLREENYTYHTWDLQTPLASPQNYEIQHVNPQGVERQPFAVMYVNTRQVGSVIIHWRVLEASLPNPIEGDIEIRVQLAFS